MRGVSEPGFYTRRVQNDPRDFRVKCSSRELVSDKKWDWRQQKWARQPGGGEQYGGTDQG